MATLTLTGKGNYTGTKSASFTITSPERIYAALKASIAWKLNLGSGCYTAQLKLACTNGLERGISNLRYLFADRVSGSKTSALLWDSSSRSARETMVWRDSTYRCVSLDAAKLSRQGVSVIYGVKDISQSKGVVAQDECTIELYVPSLAVPTAYEGLVVWTSGGSDHALVISASGGAKPVPEPTAESATPVQPILATVTAAVMPIATTEELGLRNVFTSKNAADKVLADAVLATWKGTYAMAYPEIDEDGVTNGWNTFSIKIGARGRTIVAGILANGKSVSASAQMLVGDEWCKIAVSSTLKGTTFAFGLLLSRDGGIFEVEGVDGAVIDEVGNLTGESAFKISAEVLANLLGADAEIALGDVLPEAVPVTLKGSRWFVPTVGTVRVVKKQLDYSRIRENPSALRLTFTKTTGRFMGSFNVYLWDGKKLKSVHATVKGIVVSGVGYGTAKLGKYGTMPVSVVPVEVE